MKTATATSPEHVLTEKAIRDAYWALGIPVPEMALYDQASGKQIKGNEKVRSRYTFQIY